MSDQASGQTARIAQLKEFDTPTISDALDALSLPGAVFGLAPLTVKRRIAGCVRTVKLGAPLPDLPKRHLGAGAIMAAQKGDIILIEHRGRTDVSGWGGLLSRASLAKGIVGVVVDGAVRDVDEAEELGLPVYARSPVPVTARGRVAEHDFGCPITIAGIAVDEGDYLLADGSGVVIVSQNRIDEVLMIAKRIFTKEQLMAADIDAGKPVGEVLGANYEDMLGDLSDD